MLRFTTGARAYKTRNPALSSVILVNPREGKRGGGKRARNRHKVDAISEAVRSGILSRASAKRIGRRSNRKTAAAKIRGSRVTKVRAAKKRVLKKNKRRSQEELMATRRKRAVKRRNPLKRKRRRNASKRTTAPRRKVRKTRARKTPVRRKARKSNRRAPARRKRRKVSNRRAAPKRRRNRKAARRRAAPKRRRNRKMTARRRAAPKRRRNRRAAPKRRAASRRRNPARRRSARRRNYGMSMAVPIRTRGYVGGRRRRRNPSAGSMAGGFFGTIKSTVKDLPSALKVGLNIGAGVVVAGLINGVVDRYAGATLGRATGLTSAFATMIGLALASRIGVVRKIPLINTSQMLGGVGLYAIIQLARLFMPESWRTRLGISGYDRHLPPISGFGEYVRTDGLGDYVREPWAGPAGQAVGEYVRSGSDAYEALSALQDAMTPGDPMRRANQLASASEAAGSLGEYVRTGAEVGSAMGEFDATSSWLAQGRYATSEHPSPPDQRLRQYEYGRIFAGLGLAPTVAQEAAVAVMEKEAAGMPPQMAIDTTADEYGCTSCATSVPSGVLPITADLPSGVAVPEVDGEITAGGLFANPFQNIS